MQIKIALLTLLIASGCGNTTKIDDSKLESFSNITNAGTVTLDKDGTLKRGDGSTKDLIIYENEQYVVSMYSSYSALEFISAKPLNYEGVVSFKGEVSGENIVLESVKAKQ